MTNISLVNYCTENHDQHFATNLVEAYELSDILATHLANNDDVKINFKNVTAITTAYLNRAFTPLAKQFSRKTINAHLHYDLKTVDQHYINLINLVLDTAHSNLTREDIANLID